MDEEMLTQMLASFNLREGDDPPDALVRSMQRIEIIDKAYAGMYGGLAEMRDHFRQSAEDTESDEAEVADLMRQVVLLVRFLKRREQTTINEIVPGAFPIDDVIGGPTSSEDFDCGDARALAHAVCVVGWRAWPWGTAACAAAQAAVAIACS